ncbi:MAG: hypothetical protein VR77_00580 [Flavobacteriales bacterium BRH_c54]|nr:MAG: hypothetical protein VR77_00580 [Flavobacteriales bacterium BRH_c54]
MKNKKNIEDWYKNELENFSVEPEKGSWDKLSSSMDNPSELSDEAFDDFVRDEVEHIKTNPDKAVWEKLSEKLDTTTVWERLSTTLTRYERFIWWRNFAFKSTALALFFMGVGLSINEYFNQDTHQNNEKVSTPTTVATTVEQVTTQTPTASVLASKNVLNSSTTEKEEVNQHIVSNPSKQINKLIATEKTVTSTAKKQAYIASKEVNQQLNNDKEIQLKKSNHELKEHILQPKEFLIKKENNKIIFNNKRFSSHFAFGIYAKRIYMGLNVGFKKQSMIAQLKNNSEFNSLSQNTLLDHGSSFGATAGIILSDKMNLETNVNFYSSNGYRKQYASDESSYTENLSLAYTNVSILAKRMYNKSTFDDKKYSTNIIGGLYLGYLSSATSVINGVTYKNEAYTNLDYGILLGLEQDRYLTKELIITPGIRYYQGAKNIANTENHFSFAYNSTLEFNLGIKYIFLKKH